VNLSEVPLAELRRRFAPGAERPTRSVLDALRADSRAGARSLGQALERRRVWAARESRRLAELWRLERAARAGGAERIAGVDEVGVGPLAGPLVAAAVVLPPHARLVGLDDSKRLSRRARELLDAEIRALALGVSLGWAAPDEIDRLNVYRAGLVAMRRAVEGLPFQPDALFVDPQRRSSPRCTATRGCATWTGAIPGTASRATPPMAPRSTSRRSRRSGRVPPTASPAPRCARR
jgi:ribonuclease HII